MSEAWARMAVVDPGIHPTLRSFTFEEKDLLAVRRALYRSDGPGFVLFRGFLPPALVAHVRGFWTEREPAMFGEFAPFVQRDRYQIGQGPYASRFPGKSCWFLDLWDAPLDEVTLAATVAITQLRNQIEQQPLFRDLVPCSERMTQTMVVVSTESEGIEVPWHRDEFPSSESRPEAQTRLQATLFLSEWGKDYEGDGLLFEREDGGVIHVGRDIAPAAGDLLLWRYLLRHCVGSVKPVPGGVGFARILFPPQGVFVPRVPEPEPEPEQPLPSPPPSRPTLRTFLGRFARRAGVYPWLERLRGRRPA